MIFQVKYILTTAYHSAIKINVHDKKIWNQFSLINILITASRDENNTLLVNLAVEGL